MLCLSLQGVQTQTAECLVIAETLLDNLIVVLNKVDMIPEDKREDKIGKVPWAKVRLPSAPLPSLTRGGLAVLDEENTQDDTRENEVQRSTDGPDVGLPGRGRVGLGTPGHGCALGGDQGADQDARAPL